MNESGVNGWTEYGKLVLNELERHNTLLEALRMDLSNINAEIKMLKLKSSIWGALGGMIPVILAIIVYIVKTLPHTG